jgi:DNA-binding MarR family transcriptional regulator
VARVEGGGRRVRSQGVEESAAPVQLVRRRKAARAAEFDRLIHEQTRLGILSALAVNEFLSFNDLKQILKTTDGNLSVHARKLEAAGHIDCKKFFQGRMPKTEFRLTSSGRRAFERYLDQMEQLIRAARVH